MPSKPSTEIVAHDGAACLPQNYEKAKEALALCDSVDECAEWADKAAALASYARQADDPELYHDAQRIRARAVRRQGELLLELDGRGGDRSKTGSPPTFAVSRAQAAKAAEISPHKALTAAQVAAIPAEQFEALVESPQPPGTTRLAQLGRVRRRREVITESSLVVTRPGFHLTPRFT